MSTTGARTTFAFPVAWLRAHPESHTVIESALSLASGWVERCLVNPPDAEDATITNELGCDWLTFIDEDCSGGGYDPGNNLAQAQIPHLHAWEGCWEYGPGVRVCDEQGKASQSDADNDQDLLVRLDADGNPRAGDLAAARLVIQMRTRLCRDYQTPAPEAA